MCYWLSRKTLICAELSRLDCFVLRILNSHSEPTALPLSLPGLTLTLIPCGQGSVVEYFRFTESQGASNVRLNFKLIMVLEGQFYPLLTIAF